MLRSAAAADVQTIAATLSAVINSLPSGGERVQLYRAVQDVAIAAKDTLTRNKCLRANIEGVSDPYEGYTPLVRKAMITRLALMPICGRFTVERLWRSLSRKKSTGARTRR